MNVLKEHFTHHPLHMALCALACVAIVAGIVLGAPLIAIFGPLMCGAMMLGMVWMMVTMAGKARD